jgi:hypothetical protein
MSYDTVVLVLLYSSTSASATATGNMMHTVYALCSIICTLRIVGVPITFEQDEGVLALFRFNDMPIVEVQT